MPPRTPRCTSAPQPVSDLTDIFERAIQEAKARQHAYVDTEHLLAVLLRHPGALDQLRFWSVNAGAVEFDLRRHLDQLPSTLSRNDAPQTSAAFLRVIAQVASHPHRMNTTGAMLMNALLEERDCRAVAIMRSNGLEILSPTRGTTELDNPSASAVDQAIERLACVARTLPEERRAALGKAIGAFFQTPGSDCLKHALFAMLKSTPVNDARTNVISIGPSQLSKSRAKRLRAQCA